MPPVDPALDSNLVPETKPPEVSRTEVIGIDLGGSAIKLGRFQADGTCTAEAAIATPQPARPGPVLDAVAVAVRDLDPDRRAIAIGIGTPGPSDADCRVAYIAINLPDWIDVPVADFLETQTGLPTAVENDANCAGLGEAWLGASRSVRDSILLTLGTGVGGAIVLNGQLFTGRTGAAGELGLIGIDYNGPECNSGNHGSLEQHVCARAIWRDTGKTPAELGALAGAGDAAAIAYWEQYGQYLGAGIASLVYVLMPQAVVLGGGISASAEFFLPATRAEVSRRIVAQSRFELHILAAELGSRAGAVGAAKLAWQRFGRLNKQL
ncbi:transcriptional regulator/sugar kinase [Rubidibacter lacunae KORDI 51-2]|uniref:Transcriptional regulator/sugar kinase n=1 Tax=Rubidibacter lacunae KORDI 51-2 TaxID=582515 RepID=U5DFB4_9CHRO|nr:ROK family protein [Rubidibacter lacunae]ERN39987.1 transcriptional regulator/sugar kinase [Rubidibacter lacunae KORDI 51-2]